MNNDNTNIIDIYQSEIKNNYLKLIDFYFLLSNKILKMNKKNIKLNKKCNINKEKLFNELKKNNVLTQKRTASEVENFLNLNDHGALNEKFIREIIKVKKSEFKIYQNIFNLFYYEYDILKWKEQEKNKKMEEGVKTELLLVVFKNLLKNYGNISQIYSDNPVKKNLLKNCFNKHKLIEKNEDDNNINSNMEIIKNNQEENNKNMENKNNSKSNVENKDKKKNDIDKFRVINEVDEEKEDENDEEEEDKYYIIQNDLNQNQVSYTNSNIKDSNYTDKFISSEKIKSEKNVFNEQKKTI